jgi:hypothetical protein
MNQRQLASVLFAVVGVFIAASRVPEIFVHIALLSQADPTDQASRSSGWPGIASVSAFGATLVAVGVGVSLMLFRDRLAQRLFPVATPSLELRGVQTAAFSVLGCYFAVQGLSRILWAGRFDLGAAIQLTLGVALFVGARGLSNFWLLTRRSEERRAAERAV